MDFGARVTLNMLSLLLLCSVASVYGGLSFRPPAIPLITTEPFVQTWMFGENGTAANTTYWTGDKQEMVVYARVDGKAFRLLGHSSRDDLPEAIPLQVFANATSTSILAKDPEAKVTFGLSFISSKFADDYVRLSRPVSYITISATPLDNQPHQIELYFDISAEHFTNNDAQKVGWKAFNQSGIVGVSMGVDDQTVLDLSGDHVQRDWGYQYLSTLSRHQPLVQFRAGGVSQREAFLNTGKLPTTSDTNQPRERTKDLPVLAASATLQLSSSSSQEITLLLAYDDVKSATYYGNQYQAYWTQFYPTIFDAMAAADLEYEDVVRLGEQVEKMLWEETSASAGDKYAFMSSLAYRQTLAATKLVWNHNEQVMWTFLKEISTNGDMQTMDVIYPASPMFLYSNPELLKTLLIPVLAYANNETDTPFANPFSPHQIGSYPIADATTKDQEPMPMENTGNMFLMLAGILQHSGNLDGILPRYFPLLKSWALYLNQSLPFPANQLCTDDFTGRLANNTNLAAKGIVALQAFIELCEAANQNCDDLKPFPSYFAKVWQDQAFEAKPAPHYKIAYNVSNSYSLKYNLVWQKLLNLSGPFDFEHVASTEVAYYKNMSNKYGTPLDFRHSYVKLDWLSWAAVMADNDDDFHFTMDKIYDFVVSTRDFKPLTDLYDTISGDISRPDAFIARPVVGGLFARMLDPTI